MMRTARAVGAVSLAVVATLAGGHSAEAASSCYGWGGPDRYECHAVYGARVYRAPSTTSTYIDHLFNTGPSAFECRTDSGGYVGGPHPYRWLLTTGTEHGLSGWVRDVDIYDETNPVQRC